MSRFKDRPALHFTPCPASISCSRVSARHHRPSVPGSVGQIPCHYPTNQCGNHCFIHVNCSCVLTLQRYYATRQRGLPRIQRKSAGSHELGSPRGIAEILLRLDDHGRIHSRCWVVLYLFLDCYRQRVDVRPVPVLCPHHGSQLMCMLGPVGARVGRVRLGGNQRHPVDAIRRHRTKDPT